MRPRSRKSDQRFSGIDISYATGRGVRSSPLTGVISMGQAENTSATSLRAWSTR